MLPAGPPTHPLSPPQPHSLLCLRMACYPEPAPRESLRSRSRGGRRGASASEHSGDVRTSTLSEIQFKKTWPGPSMGRVGVRAH